MSAGEVAVKAASVKISSVTCCTRMITLIIIDTEECGDSEMSLTCLLAHVT